MEEERHDDIQPVDLKKTMETNYIEYSMSVIVDRALPDVRDGLKPVQRRILHAMNELNNTPDKQHRKCARIVGDTMGKYHPHGDSSIYGALVNLAQEWNTHYPLVDGHGNFGSVDGDGAAAMRYTEARLSKISMEMRADINKDTVDFIPNFDETEQEPTVLPSRFPNLLVNGTSGIAVGMATNIPPHNLSEVIDGVVRMIDNRVEEDRETSVDELMTIIQGPDFPTGATILGRRGIEEAYRTGRGKIRVRAVTDIEDMGNGKSRIVVTELPYMVNKARLQEKIADLHKEKKIDGITELRDESNREGMRLVIELRKDANPNVVLNQLYKHTQMQDTFGANMLAVVPNKDGVLEPKVLNLQQMLTYYLHHQEEVVTRRTKFDLKKAEERAHIVQGLLVALDNIDEVIKIIRGSNSTAEARQKLEDRFALDEIQSNAIVEMRLRALTGLEREKLENEYAELQKKIAEFKEILADHNELLKVIKKEILAIKEKFGDDRKTTIGFDVYDISIEDLIPVENCVLAMTHKGYIKRMTPDNFRSQHRGGKGIKGMQTIEDDYIEDLLMATTHHYVMFFTNTGRCFRIKAYEIPEAGRTARGTAIINLLMLEPNETITAMIAMHAFDTEKYLFMATKNGTVKKTKLDDYKNIRKSGLIAINLREGDELIEVKLTDNTNDIFLITKKGMSIRFPENEARTVGRASIGVKGITLSDGDEVVAMQMHSQGDRIIFATEFGKGKITMVSEFNAQHRGGRGVKCYKIKDDTGEIVGAKCIDKSKEIMLITNEGVIIRMNVADIRPLGRITSGVKLMDIDRNSDVRIASIAKVREEIVDDNPDGAPADYVPEDLPESPDESEKTVSVDKGIDKLLDAANKDKKDEDGGE
ncbi:MAG: DNA gyrase subunit A [Eubacterium sp.]|nr:DNA gyrase subunit A [Eubacterium sp.]